jgi:ATP-dependent Lon protease
MYHQTPDLPGGFDGIVRLFPLPDLVCFPFTVQPLHIFESRYREMLEDALRDDQLICMATLTPGYQPDYYSRPPISENVCIGRVASHKCRADGTYDLILVGFWRAIVESEDLPVRSYRRAKVQVLPEKIVQAEDLANSPNAGILAQLANKMPSVHELLEAFQSGKMTLNGLTDILAFHLPLTQKMKLDLLAQPDSMIRAQMLLEAIDGTELGAQKEAASREEDFPPNFSNN